PPHGPRHPPSPVPATRGHSTWAAENGGAKRRKWFASIMRQSKNGEFYEENLGKQFCGLIADRFNDKIFRRKHLKSEACGLAF
ncbi:MAG: hypothetical protein IJ808_09350, partial [Muribaculaceae bacterium]|nr:hypothetical protein [Muribaculaceae bacterium]